MRRSHHLVKYVAVVLLMAGCNGLITNPAQDQLRAGALTADIREGNFVFISSGARATDFSTEYVITATEDQPGQPLDEITITVPKSATLPYTVATPSDAIVQVTYNDALTSTQYLANATEGSCVVTITQLTPTIQGTFTATMKAHGTTDDTRVLTNGAFNASY